MLPGRLISVLLIIVVSAFFAGRYWFPSTSSVANYLESHPELLADRPELIELARPLMAERARARLREERRERVKTDWAGFLTAKETPRLGTVTDPLVVIEFSDFACLPCKENADTVAYLASSNPDSQIIQVYVPIGPTGAELAARAAIAVWQHFPSEYARVHDDLMATPVAQLDARAKTWLDDPAFADTDMWQAIGHESVRQVLQQGRAMFDSLNVRVVPSFLIDGELLAGPASPGLLQSTIDQARENMRPAAVLAKP